MQPPRQHSPINLTELKAQIVMKLGPDGSKEYFYHLNRFLSLKLNKIEFNNLCVKILGRENIPLHNLLVRSILKKACISKPGTQINGEDTTCSSNHRLNGSHTNTTHPFASPGFLNGGNMLLPISPKKARTGSRDRKGGARRSTLGLNDQSNFTRQPENGFLMQKSANGEDRILGPHGPNSSLLRRCTSFSAHLCSEQERSFEGVEEPSLPTSPIEAPFGVSFFPGGAHRASTSMGSFFNHGILSDSATLREPMERIALAKGLERVSLDSANLLNHGLDSYLKRLIRSCTELVGSINGVRPGWKNLVQNIGKPLEVQEQRTRTVSLRDFRVAMEMNARTNLGGDRPLFLEKICINAFEE